MNIGYKLMLYLMKLIHCNQYEYFLVIFLSKFIIFTFYCFKNACFTCVNSSLQFIFVTGELKIKRVRFYEDGLNYNAFDNGKPHNIVPI